MIASPCQVEGLVTLPNIQQGTSETSRYEPAGTHTRRTAFKLRFSLPAKPSGQARGKQTSSIQ